MKAEAAGKYSMVQNAGSSLKTQLAGLEAKAPTVCAGEDTFTMAQAQKILAGPVLVVVGRLE